MNLLRLLVATIFSVDSIVVPKEQLSATKIASQNIWSEFTKYKKQVSLAMQKT